jgi:hypothetical protein
VVGVAGGKRSCGGGEGRRRPVPGHRCWRRRTAAALGFRDGEDFLHGSSEVGRVSSLFFF